MEPIGIETLVKSIFTWQTWVIILIAAVFGMIGGLSHKLTSPPEDRTSLPGYIVVGIVASIAILFVFTPPDAIRLIALSLAAGYAGKAVLNALEARVKTAIARAETAKAKEEGKKAVGIGKEAISHAQKLTQVNMELEKRLMEATKQPREIFLESLIAQLPEDFDTFVTKLPDTLKVELNTLSVKLGSSEEFFKK